MIVTAKGDEGGTFHLKFILAEADNKSVMPSSHQGKENIVLSSAYCNQEIIFLVNLKVHVHKTLLSRAIESVVSFTLHKQTVFIIRHT